MNAATNVTEQPLLGIFSNGQCPLIYSLPNGIIGGPIYIYTTADDGSRPEILTRIKMTSSAFVCNPPPSTIVEYIIFGTMQVSVGSFVLQYAGYNSVLPRGCSASLAFTFPPSILAANPGLGVVNPVIPPGALLSTSPNTITTNAGAGLLMTPAVVVANPQLSVVNLVTVAPTPKSQQTGKGELPFGTPLPPKVVDTSPARDNKGAKNDKGLGKGKQKFLRS